MLKGKIQKKEENFVNIQDLELNKEFKEFLNEYENSFITDIYTGGEMISCIIYREYINDFLEYEKECEVDFDDVRFYRDLEKLNQFMIDNKIDYIQL